MENTKDKNIDSQKQQADIKQPARHNIPKIIGLSFAGLVLAIVVVLIGINLYLTPQRLKNIISNEGSRYLSADVRVGNVDYTLWSSFPNLRISLDSIAIDSRTLEGVSPRLLSKIPEDSKELLRIEKFSGAVNMWNVLRGTIAIKDINVVRPSCNIVVVNDSVNNFSIFPKLREIPKIPHITISTIDVGAPIDVDYFNLPEQMSCDAVVRQASLTLVEGKKDNYNIALAGDIDLKWVQVSTVSSLPFSINSDIAMGFSPLTVTVNKLNADLADIKTSSDISLVADKQLVVSKLNTDLSCNDALAVSKYFHFTEESELNAIEGSLPLFAKLSLESPYQCVANENENLGLPAFTLSVNIPGGEVDYPVGKKEMLPLRDLLLQADLHINPEVSEGNAVLVPMAHAVADGSVIDLSGTVIDLLSGDPLLSADIKCVADLAKMYGMFVKGNGMKIEGKIAGESSLSCRLSGLKDKKISDLNVKGDFLVSQLKISDAVSKMAADVQDLSLKLRASVPSLSSRGLAESKLNLIADAGNINAATPDIKFNANGVGVSLAGAKRKAAWIAPGYSAVPTSIEDSLIMNRVRHSPEFLIVALPENLRKSLSLVDLDADVKIGSGEFIADGYKAHNKFANVDLYTNLDTLTIKNMQMSTRGAEGVLKGKVYGLRGFLLSPSPAPLTADLEARLNDVNVNELSGNYYAVHSIRQKAKEAIGEKPKTNDQKTKTKDKRQKTNDEQPLCVLIPRNLFADIRLHSDRAEYMGWHFSPLSTDITLHDGVAKIGELTIGSGFGTVTVDWTYSTADLHDIFMQLNADINDFDVEGLFKTFPMITASAPELSNLSGKLSAEADGKFLMFPDMYVNAPSMTAEANLHISDVEFKREGKIKRITNLLLIRGDTPLEISDLDIHTSFHDNLLQLDPFMLDCGPYKLGVAGVNNLQGEIYYHLGIHGSPLHIPFGVNLVGNWHHPSIRFGGANIHDGREREISSNLKDDVHVNIMQELKHGWELFVENAAKYDAKNNQQYVFNVD